ncbi:MAG: STM4014 family protein [bacterium]
MIVVVGNPENRRVEYFVQACKALGAAPPRVIAWLDVLAHPEPSALVDAPLIRIESPGENPLVESLLVQRGARLRGSEPPGWTTDPARDHGRIRDQSLWFDGFADVLAQLGACNGTFMIPPAEITTMFDKVASRGRYANEVRTPRLLGTITDYERLLEYGESNARMFVKPRYGSSASGVLAFRARPARTMTTSVELDGNALYNSLKIRQYVDESAQRHIVDVLAADGLFAESWIPKACLGGAFDFRVVVIGGEPCHTVMRVSSSPLTNLHLGNRRGDLVEFANRHPVAFQRVRDAARSCARAFDAM